MCWQVQLMAQRASSVGQLHLYGSKDPAALARLMVSWSLAALLTVRTRSLCAFAYVYVCVIFIYVVYAVCVEGRASKLFGVWLQ
jgi:hypothetical protein